MVKRLKHQIQASASQRQKEEKEFVAFCRGERAPETFFEKTWNKYRTRINTTKRVYTLSGDVSEAASGGEDYSGE